MSKIIEQNLLAISAAIESMVQQHGCTYIDACTQYCLVNNLEVEYVGEILQKNLRIRSAIQREAEDLNFLKRTTRLDI
jgi:hypothetical protein